MKAMAIVNLGPAALSVLSGNAAQPMSAGLGGPLPSLAVPLGLPSVARILGPPKAILHIRHFFLGDLEVFRIRSSSNPPQLTSDKWALPLDVQSLPAGKLLFLNLNFFVLEHAQQIAPGQGCL